MPTAAPILASIFLWIVAGFALAASLLMGLTALAGYKPASGSVLPTFALVAAITAVFHTGYFIAPIALGKTWWKAAFWSTAPIAALILITLLISHRYAIKNPAALLNPRLLFLAVFPAALYLGPPITLFLCRPR